LLCPLNGDCAAAPIDAAQLERLRTTGRRRPSEQNRVPFVQTARYARGRIVDRLRELPPGERISLLDLHAAIGSSMPGRSFDEVREFVVALAREGLVSHDGTSVSLQE